MRQATHEALGAFKEWELPIDVDRLPTQHDFIFDFQHRFTAYGGGLGNGKTTGGCARAVLLSLMFPDNRGYMGRFDGKEFKQTTFIELLKLLPPNSYTKNDQLGILTFKPRFGGSQIVYGDLKEERFNNINLGWFYVDQAEEIDESRWNLLVSRLRKQTLLFGDNTQTPLTNNEGKALQAQTYGFATFNPEGTHSYIWRFFHPDSPERKCVCAERTVCLQHDYKLYQATTYDGLAAGFVNQTYVDSILAVYPENARRRYLEGAWDVFEGRVYPQFDDETHVYPSEQLQEYVRTHAVQVYETIDHGLKNPTAVLWVAVDEFNNRFIIDEHYEGGPDKPVKYHCEVIKAKRAQFKQPIAITYLDSSCWAQNQSKGDSVYAIADEYNDHGIFPVPGQKDWGAGYNRINEGLNFDANHDNPFTGDLGAPHIYVAYHCVNFRREALGYRWKKNRLTIQRNQPDVPQDINDHCMDAWYYFEASRVPGPRLVTKKTIDPLRLVQERIKNYNPMKEDDPVGSWMSH